MFIQIQPGFNYKTPSAVDVDARLFADPPLQVASADVRQRVIDVVRNVPLENRLPAITGVLKSHNLAGSFKAHLEDQIRTTGKIRIAVMDDFSPGHTHGTNVEARIRSNAPAYLRHRIQIVRYDVGGLNATERGQLMQRMAADASAKRVVAVSVSGGVDAYGVTAIESWIGKPLNRSTAAAAFQATAKRAHLTPQEAAGWAALANASRRIPCVTPVWNNGTTTLAAMGMAASNGIVTTIDKSSDSVATEVPLFDARMPAQWGNGFASQSAPTFIGQALGLLTERRLIDIVSPKPQPSGLGNGGLPQ